jgi:saccharopine dehydrogenase-like NADP-dependent oxidoreductase
LGNEEEELTVMRVIIEGEKNGSLRHIEYNLLDHYDSKTKTSSMGRTTGYTCTAAVHLMANKLFIEKGVFPPELVGKNQTCFDFVMAYLKTRGVNWRMTEY